MNLRAIKISILFILLFSFNLFAGQIPIGKQDFSNTDFILPYDNESKVLDYTNEVYYNTIESNLRIKDSYKEFVLSEGYKTLSLTIINPSDLTSDIFIKKVDNANGLEIINIFAEKDNDSVNNYSIKLIEKDNSEDEGRPVTDLVIGSTFSAEEEPDCDANVNDEKSLYLDVDNDTNVSQIYIKIKYILK